MKRTSRQPATIHDEAAEKVELAKTYAEDGAFASAARIYREIADMYQRRAEEIHRDFAGYSCAE